MFQAGGNRYARRDQWRSASRANNGRPGSRPIVLALLFAILLAGCAPGGQTARPPRAAAAILTTPMPAPTATPTPDPMIAQNAQRGCAPTAPTPPTEVVYTGKRQGQSAPAPNEVALTFDDGPTPYSSPAILSVLEQTHTPATVFVEGQYVHEWPYLLQREWNDGFAIAVHTWDHPMMSKLSADQMNHQFGDTVKAIHQILGANACVWLWRPPYGDYNRAVLNMAAGYGLTTVTWDDSSDDWDRPGVQKIVNNVLTQAHPGAIILMHDGPSFRDQTAAAIPGILDGLRARGLTPVTLPRLLADGGYPVQVPHS